MSCVEQKEELQQAAAPQPGIEQSEAAAGETAAENAAEDAAANAAADTPSEETAADAAEQVEAAHDEAGEKGCEKHGRKESKKLKKLEEQLSQLQQQKADLTDSLLRKAAEFDNFRKRTEREKQESVSLGTAAALQALLPAFDALKLAEAAPCSDENFKKGVELTLASFRSGLEKLGVRELNPLGEPFDPKLHNALFTEPAAEGQPSGVVTKVLQSGYIRGERVIRCAMVAVSE